MTYRGFVLDSDDWWRRLTAGIFFLDFGTLRPSPTISNLPLTLITTGKATHYRPDPLADQNGDIQGWGVKEIEESVIRVFIEAENPDDTEDTEDVAPDAHTCEREIQPQKGGRAGRRSLTVGGH